MRQHVIAMTMKAVVLAVVILGLPLLAVAPWAVWQEHTAALQVRADSLSRLVDGVQAREGKYSYAHLLAWTGADHELYAEVKTRTGEVISEGYRQESPRIVVYSKSEAGNRVMLEHDGWQRLIQTIGVGAAIIFASLAAIGVARFLAGREARKLSAPLIYLAAQAEQVGRGQVRSQVRPCGIEEIDLVQEELVRTSERLAGRLAAERQFAANVSHQLRTPLTALSMRLEEIEMLTQDEEIRTEVEQCLQQVERLTAVVSDLLQASRERNRGSARAIALAEIFDQQDHEWGRAFAQAGRELVFTNPDDVIVLATPGSLSQIIATLIENSLKYGAGTVRIEAAYGPSKRIVTIDVSDAGPGVSDEIAPKIFEKGVSGHGSTGIGLALARTLAQTDGARVELVKRRPPLFRVTVTALPSQYSPKKVLPQAVAAGNHMRRRF